MYAPLRRNVFWIYGALQIKIIIKLLIIIKCQIIQSCHAFASANFKDGGRQYKCHNILKTTSH